MQYALLKRCLYLATRRFGADCSASVAMEYAVIGALIGAAVIASVTVLGGTVEGFYDRVVEAFSS